MKLLFNPGKKLRNRIIMSFIFAISPAILLVVAIVELFIAPMEKKQIQDELAQTTKLLANSIQASASIAIREHLKSIADCNREYARILLDEVKTGLRSREEALATLRKHIHSQRIGDTGYVFCLNSKKILVIHPKEGMEGIYSPDENISRLQLSTGDGYFEYKWRNPMEKEARDKALYQVYFKPLDWYISVTSYRSEFAHLLNPEDFRKAANLLRFGKSGYAYIFTTSGDVVIHPLLKSFNIFNQNEIDDSFARKMVAGTKGLVEYYWPDNESGKLKRKIGAFIKLRDLNWIVASAAYTDEVYAPVHKLRLILYGGCILLVILAGGIALFLSKRITFPLEQMVSQLDKNSRDNTPTPLEIVASDEIGTLAQNFNRYLHMLNEREEALQKERQMLSDITNNSPGVFYQFCLDDSYMPKFLYVSERFNDFTGIGATDDDLVNKIIDHLGISDKEIFWASLKKAAESHTDWQFEGQFRRTDGTTIWISTAASASMRDGVLIYNGFLADITERKRLEEQIYHIQKMDAIGKLAGGIAHDFNNLIGGIMGAAEVLQIKEQGSINVRQSTDLILKTATMAAKLTEKLLTFSRKEKLENTYFKLADVVKEAITLLDHTLDKKIRISMESQTDQTTVLGDFSQLQNAFLNLGINSGHAMPDGGELKFIIRQVHLDQDYCNFSKFKLTSGAYIQVEINDNGCGISPKDMQHIFEPFFTTKAMGKGTGLGLAAVYGAIQQHHGAITVYSEVDVGTSFHVMLPAVTTDEKLDQEVREPIPGSGKILLIEDDPVILITTEALLRSLGYDVTFAADGAEGVVLYQAKHDSIDLVLMDMVMPNMNGRECFREIRRINPQAKVILASGFSQEEDVLQLQKDGLSGFIRKPYRKYELSKIISDVLHED